MPTEKSTIDAYNAYAKRWAEKIRGQINLPHEHLEKPAMYRKLTNLKGKSVLCIGCGTGEECGYIKSLGASKVVGIDISKGVIEIAKQTYKDVDFYLMDMEKIEFPKLTFDLIYSSLTLHYVNDWKPVLRSVYQVLKKGGTFLFSTHHPVKWGAIRVRSKRKNSFVMGAEWTNKTNKIYGDYLNITKINDVWFGELNVTYYNRPISVMVKDILSSGFKIIDIDEPKPTVEAKQVNMNFWKIHSTIPLFIIFQLKK